MPKNVEQCQHNADPLFLPYDPTLVECPGAAKNTAQNSQDWCLKNEVTVYVCVYLRGVYVCMCDNLCQCRILHILSSFEWSEAARLMKLTLDPLTAEHQMYSVLDHGPVWDSH